MVAIALDGVSVRRGDSLVLDRVTLDVGNGELLGVVGPSGSGKTSLLRAIAGLDEVVAGSVMFGGYDVTSLPTRDRDVAMVFQDAVLYPFLTAGRNVAFPLRLRDVDREEIRRRVTAEGRALDIEAILDRWPKELSAGHQQLVQVARAMVRVPAVFLLDEPLARVGAALRTRLRGEIRFLQAGYGVTTVYVTNDTTEAMAIADRIAVLKEGRVEQVGAAGDVYARPATRFVAEFLAEHPVNVWPVDIESAAEGAWLVASGLRLRVWSEAIASRAGRRGVLVVRPEELAVADDGEGIPARVERAAPLGGSELVELVVGDRRGWLRREATGRLPDRVAVRLDRWHLYDEGGALIAHSD